MSNNITTEKLQEIPAESEEKIATVPLTYHEMCMTRNYKTVRHLVICWAISVVLVVLAFVFLWLQYDYVTTTEYSGVYNITDSEGNVITSDITPEDVIRILEVLGDGESAQNQG